MLVSQTSRTLNSVNASGRRMVRRPDGTYEVYAPGGTYSISGLGSTDAADAKDAAKTDSGFIAWVKDNPWAAGLMATGLLVLAWGIYSYMTKKKPARKRKSVSGLGRTTTRRRTKHKTGGKSAASRSAAAKKAARTRKKNAAARSDAAKKAAATRKRNRR